jgi:hypothetical protein
MGWRPHAGSWRPVVHVDGSFAESEVVVAINGELANGNGFSARRFHKNVKMSPRNFRRYAQLAINIAPGHSARLWLDFMAAVGTDAAVDKNGNVLRSSLQMVNGGKRQDFVSIIRKLVLNCTEEHIRNTLFGGWQYADSMTGENLRWDPCDDRRHAYRWDDPSGANTRRSGSQLGANRLAIEALPLFPVCPVGRGARTAGFDFNSEHFIWPIWGYVACVDAVRSLLAMAELRKDNAEGGRFGLRCFGVEQIFSARRFAVDKYQTCSFSSAESV